MQTIKGTILIGAIVIGIGALLIPGINLAPEAFAGKVAVHDFVFQLNTCTGRSLCDNQAQNNAQVHLPPHRSTHVKISQHIEQANVCDHDSNCENNAVSSFSVPSGG